MMPNWVRSLAWAALIASAPLLRAESAYLFSYFTGRGEDGLKLAWSNDALNWKTVAGGRSLLPPQVGEAKLMRDPCLLLGPDGTFHLVWTTSWEGVTIGYASSRDLINWSPQRALPVMANIAGTRNCWAPEIVYDSATDEFIIFWSSTVSGQFTATDGSSENGYNHRIYYTTTRDFETLAPAALLYDPGFSVIDATFARASNGQLYWVIKDETRFPPKKHLRVAAAESFRGPFGPLREPFTQDWVEGPSALTVGDQVIVYFDVYRERLYQARRSRDLMIWEDLSHQVTFPPGMRHGTALPVPSGIVEALRQLPPE